MELFITMILFGLPISEVKFAKLALLVQSSQLPPAFKTDGTIQILPGISVWKKNMMSNRFNQATIVVSQVS